MPSRSAHRNSSIDLQISSSGSANPIPALWILRNLPLSSPLHSLVSNQQWDSPEQDLTLCPSPDVENCGVCGTGQSALAVLSETVGDDTLLGLGACVARIVSIKVIERSSRGGSVRRRSCQNRVETVVLERRRWCLTYPGNPTSRCT